MELFREQFERLFRYLDRLTGEPDLAKDLAQETFVRLYQRGAAPDVPEAWLITVATNLLRNARSKQARRVQLLTRERGAAVHSEPPPLPGAPQEEAEIGRRVRDALDRLPERERQMLLLKAEGYSYRAIAQAVAVREASVGTLLARAKAAFRSLYEGGGGAS